MYPICCQRQFPQHLAVERDLGAGPQRRNLSSLKDEDIGFVCACVRVDAHLCPTLCNPVDYSLPGSSVHGIVSGKKTGAGYHFLSRDLPDSRD